MTTLTGEEARKYLGRTVFDSDHEMVGQVDRIYFSDATGEPVWVSISTDFLAERDAFIPAAQIVPFGEGVSIPLARRTIQQMPRIEPHDGVLSSAQVARLHEFFGTFSGQHFASAHQGAPKSSYLRNVPKQRTPAQGPLPETPVTTGAPRSNELHDVSLQGTGNPAP